MDRVQQFREAAAAANNHPLKAAWRYSKALRRLALDHYQDRRREGYRHCEIAKELGIGSTTLTHWRRAEEPKTWRTTAIATAWQKTEIASASFQPVRVIGQLPAPTSVLSDTAPDGLTAPPPDDLADPTPDGLRVTTPGGLSIEGLSFQQVVELVRMGT
jgi:transposase-like protein